jgi:multidrug resistance efflux pump
VRRECEAKHRDLEIKQRTRQGEVEGARLELANLELRRSRPVVRAPADGIVTVVKGKVGDIVQPGKVGLATAQQRRFQFEVTVVSADVAHLRPGMPVRIKLDAYDYQTYGTLDGTVQFVAPDSEVVAGSQGPQAALYRVRIALSREEIGRRARRGRVKLGMTGQAEIVTGRERILTLLLRRIRLSISLN